YVCAQHFVKNHGVKKLVLTGREIFPDRSLWGAHRHTASSLGEKIRNIERLESQGVVIEVLSVDLTDAAALRSSVASVKARLGSIGGVLHSTGITSDPTNPAFIRKPMSSMEAVLSPKIEGLDNLYSILQGEPLAFFILFSSVSAIIPRLG